ncbi:MAG: hypothetical protein ACJ72D_04475 [Marmoricola sp.]
MGKRQRGVAVVLALVVVAVVGVLARGWWKDAHRSDLSRALDVVPSATLRLSFTDWSAVRDQLGVHGTTTSSKRIATMISTAYDTDLSAVSSIDGSAVALQKYFGFSPGTMDWEAYAQADAGATMVVRMPDDFDLGKVTAKLADLGFTKPKKSDGVWVGGTDLVAAIDPTITPELQYVAVLADKHLVVTSDGKGYAAKAAAVAAGRGRSLGDLAGARGAVDVLDEPVAAMFWSRDFACTDLAMSQATEDDQDAADALVTKAGKITPLQGLVMALRPDRDLVVAERFGSAGEAKENLRARARLAVGDAPGRGGSFSDDQRLTSSRTDGSSVLLTMRPKEKKGYVLSALDSGPLLFATC